MRVKVKVNNFTVRKLKPNIFENYQLIEATKNGLKSGIESGNENGISSSSSNCSGQLIIHEHQNDTSVKNVGESLGMDFLKRENNYRLFLSWRSSSRSHSTCHDFSRISSIAYILD